MTTKRLQFFMRCFEFDALLHMIIEKQNLKLVGVLAGTNAIIGARNFDLHEIQTKMKAGRIYIASEESVCAVARADFIPAQMGWMQIDVPREEGDVLYKAELSSKSDWIDTDTGRENFNDISHKIHLSFARAFKKNLSSGLTVTNIISQKSEFYRNIWWSNGAAEWNLHGGELRQYGVKNIRYSIGE